MAQGTEFSIIDDLFAPLCEGAVGSFGLKNDGALINLPNAVVTKDVLIEGVHFRSKDRLDTVARKLLRVNLSDLAAMGAMPEYYFLGCCWRRDIQRWDIAAFVDGLEQDQRAFDVTLMGGDTTVHRRDDAPLVFSLTMIGRANPAGSISRDGAQAGDDVYISGTIGDAGLGLYCFDDDIGLKKQQRDYVQDRYWLPQPRLTLGQTLVGVASAGLDVSDGVIADAGHLAAHSKVGLSLRAQAMPLSKAAQDWLTDQPDPYQACGKLCGAGDDYELLFCAPPSRRKTIEKISEMTDTPVSRIGTVVEGRDVRLLKEDGAVIKMAKTGFDHFGS